MSEGIFNFNFSRTAIKWIAVLTMVIDHVAFCFLSTSHELHMLYLVMRGIGRIAFPLFCYLLVQGYLTTGDVKKYILRLFLFALISELPFDLFCFHRLVDFRGQNVLFTLCIALLVLCAMKRVQDTRVMFCFLFLGSAAAILLHTDYRYLGVVYAVVMYLFRREPVLKIILPGCVMVMQGGLNIFELLSLPFLYLCRQEEPETAGSPDGQADYQKDYHRYRGKRKYFFYIFYPAHLLVLYGIWAMVR